MITPNVTGMPLRSLHAYEGFQFHNKVPEKIKKLLSIVPHSFCALHSPSPIALHHAGGAATAATAATGSFSWRQEEERESPAPPCSNHNNDPVSPPSAVAEAGSISTGLAGAKAGMPLSSPAKVRIVALHRQ
jgi:hypothetical protein